jgi:deoxyribodipyrimidine photo-lyase
MPESLALPGFEDMTDRSVFQPTREAGLAQLQSFLPNAGQAYAGRRNFDFGPRHHTNVSRLSPWIRHRLVTEDEVLRQVLDRHTAASAEKFIQEIFWRGYFKGWLEHHPSVWHSYRTGLSLAREACARESARAADLKAALDGRTGIEAFDSWVRELVTTGYLHNHARMWFASIWIFTLRLPWELGADFFLRHLLDGDPASNTLSWRWVGGLHTKGKAYQARAANIEKYTGGRFNPQAQLAPAINALHEDIVHPLVSMPLAEDMSRSPYLLLVTEDDCAVEADLTHPPSAILGLVSTDAQWGLARGALAHGFASSAVAEAVDSAKAQFGVDGTVDAGAWPDAIETAAQSANVTHVVTLYAPVGPVAEALANVKPDLADEGITLHQPRRRYDDLVWPHATKGFFALKKKIPSILRDLGLM